MTVRQVEFNWNVPTQRNDGTPLNNLAGYTIYWGTDSGVYSDRIDISNPQQTSHLLTLSPGTYYFAFTAVDTDDIESPISTELSKTIQ